jgi:hypothetical protein
MGVKIKCPGHKPWEVDTGDIQYHLAIKNVRNQNIRKSCSQLKKS